MHLGVISLIVFATITVIAAFRNWEGMSLVFGLACLLVGCELLDVAVK